MDTNLYQQLVLLTDSEAKSCLNGLLHGFTIRHPEHAKLINDPAQMVEVIRGADVESKNVPSNVEGIVLKEDPKAIRLILLQAAEDEELGPKLKAFIESKRPTLLEPVTSALVLAGIILVLSTRVEIKYEKENGKTHVKVHVEKSSTSNKLLEKFFGFFK